MFGGLDAAVAVAGVVSGGVPLWELGDAQWNVQFDVNVDGVRNLATAAVPVLLEAPAPRQGRVVAVASAAGLLGLRRLSGYSASKHAVIGLIKALAADLAGTGITANAVCPGSTRTPILDASAAVYGLASAEEFAHQQLVERLLVPDEPAALIAWLCAPEASGVTGAALSVDGGSDHLVTLRDGMGCREAVRDHESRWRTHQKDRPANNRATTMKIAVSMPWKAQ